MIKTAPQLGGRLRVPSPSPREQCRRRRGAQGWARDASKARTLTGWVVPCRRWAGTRPRAHPRVQLGDFAERCTGPRSPVPVAGLSPCPLPPGTSVPSMSSTHPAPNSPAGPVTPFSFRLAGDGAFFGLCCCHLAFKCNEITRC